MTTNQLKFTICCSQQTLSEVSLQIIDNINKYSLYLWVHIIIIFKTESATFTNNLNMMNPARNNQKYYILNNRAYIQYLPLSKCG